MINDNKAPMISTEAIFLLESNFIRYPEKPEVIVPSVEMGYESTINDHTGQGILTLNVTCSTLDPGTKVFEARIRYIGVFVEDVVNPNMSIDEFMKVNAPAHIFPFAREYLSSLTTRSNLPPVILPPVNIASLIHAKLDGKIQDKSSNVEQGSIK